ncbi:MAG: hypothetical protein ABI885_04160 [Gammaproteobacteria bacterium]
MLRSIVSGNPAHAVPQSNPNLDELPIRLREHVQRLRLVLPVISVSVMALRLQNAEFDEDIASVLYQGACDPLDRQIEDLDTILQSLRVRRAGEVAP